MRELPSPSGRRPHPSSSSRIGKDRPRGRRRRTRTVCALLFLCVITTSFAQEPQVRARLNLPNDIWVGQRIVFVIELLAPGIFAGTPAFDLPDPPGLQLLPPSETPVLSNEQIDGVSYTVQRHEVLVFPQRAGEMKIPALTIRFGYKRSPLDKEVVPATVRTEPAQFTAKVPAGAERLGSLISARDLKVIESWKPEPGKAKAGDAFTRTIVYTAPDVPAMAFPPFPTRPIDGLGVYPKPPEVLDHSERGVLSGERRDTITYVCQRPGEFVIPAARLTWFDLDGQQLRTIDFPTRTLNVAVNPALTETASESATSNPWRLIKSWLVPVLVFVILPAAGIVWRTKLATGLQALLAPLRPIHLQPLNPNPRQVSVTGRRI